MTLSVMKKPASIILALWFATGITACDESDVAIGAGLIGIGAGIIAIDRAHDRDHHRDRNRDHYRPPKRNRCQTSYETKCVTYRDRRGRKQRDCRQVAINRCHGTYSMQMVAQTDLDGGVTETAQQWAETYSLSYSGAQKIIAALENSYRGDAGALQEIGLQSKDLKSLAQFKMISDDGLMALSENLNQHVDDTESMINMIMAEGQSQAQESSSFLWQSCVGSGHWKTPENSSCKQVSWEGCSVDTGATMCIPKR